jgi:hypothetical protein
MSVDSALKNLFKRAIVSPNLAIEKNEKVDFSCSNYFGYLAENIQENLPEQCLTCSKVIDCILLPLGAMSNPILNKMLLDNQMCVPALSNPSIT